MVSGGQPELHETLPQETNQGRREAGRKREEGENVREKGKKNGRKTEASPLTPLAMKSLYHVTLRDDGRRALIGRSQASRALS